MLRAFVGAVAVTLCCLHLTPAYSCLHAAGLLPRPPRPGRSYHGSCCGDRVTTLRTLHLERCIPPGSDGAVLVGAIPLGSRRSHCAVCPHVVEGSNMVPRYTRERLAVL